MDKKQSPPRQLNKMDNPKDIRVVALGGLGEVGKNCYVLEHNNCIYIIDFGVLFPGSEHMGVDYIISNYEYLKKNESKIKGLFITHGHEDHIGGIPFLLKKVKIPKIYAPRTALLMIEKKFKEHKLSHKIELINQKTTLKFGDVTLHTFSMSHSIPDALGFFFETPAGNIVTTGDFKIDFSPPVEYLSDFHKMTELSKKGVMCMMSDSTNSLTPGISVSEKLVGKNLTTLIKEADGRIIFTTFASNIHRVQQIIKGAVQNNRKVCVMGRSLNNAIEIGLKTGYIDATKADIIEPKQLKNFKPKDVCVICTGSQGEELAALSRMANGINVHLELSNKDTIVFASNPIPGNTYSVGKVIDSLLKIGCHIISNSSDFITHASGHASEEEQKLILRLIKPKYFAPVHGTHNMLKKHLEIGYMMGVQKNNGFTLRNGDFLDFINGRPEKIVGAINANPVFISGGNMNVSLSDSSVEQLASDGIFIVISYVDKNKNLLSYPQITTRGFVVINDSLELLRTVQTEFVKTYNAKKKLSSDELNKELVKTVKNCLFKETNKQPLIEVSLLDYEPTKKDGKPSSQKKQKVA